MLKLAFVLPLLLVVNVCSSPTSVDVNQSQSQSQTQHLGASPSPSPSGGCPSVTQVRLGLMAGAPGTILVGGTTQLDATPVSGDMPLSKTCSEILGVNWLGDGVVCTRVGATQSFNPEIRGLARGVCSYIATVGGVASPSYSIVVQ
jgi:hypothetical protein